MNCGLGVYNGATFDGKFYIGNQGFSSGNWVEASGEGTTLWSTNGAHFYVGNTAGSSWNRFTLSDSAHLLMKDGTFFVGANAGCNFNTAALLSGASVTGQAATVVGNSGDWNTLTAQDAELRMTGYLTVGWYSGGNTLRLTNTIVQTTGLYVGRDATSWGSNTLEFVGCTLTNKELRFQFGMQKGENTVVLRNGTRIAASTGSVGVDSSAAVSNTMTLLEGSVFTTSGAFNFGSKSSFNTMIVDNSSFIASNVTFCLGYSAGTANSNTLAVINGGYLFATQLRIGDQGAYNTLIISNATVHAGSENCTIPYNANGNSTNNTVIFAGTNCLLQSEADITVRGGTTLEFVIPRGGYLEPPMQTIVNNERDINLDPTVKIKLDITEFARGGGGKQVLARTIDTFGISEATLNLLNAQIAPQNCSLELVDKDLVLTTPYTGGTVLSLH